MEDGERVTRDMEGVEKKENREEKKGKLRLVVVNSTEPKAPKQRERCTSPRTGWGSLLEQAGESR